MHKATRRNRALTATSFSVVGAVLLSTGTPALAQYSSFNYLSYGLGSMLWPMRNMMYMPYNYLPYGLFYPTTAALSRYRGMPGYSGTNSPYANPQSQQNANQQSQQNANPQSQPTVEQSYTDAEPVTDPRQRVRQVRGGKRAVDQISHAKWADPNNAATAPPQAVHNAPGAPAAANGMAAQPPGQAPAVSTNYPQAQPIAYAPSVAPQRDFNPQPTPIPPAPAPAPQVPPPNPRPELPPQAPPPVPLSRGPAPLAANFVNEVNTKYDGDISKALFDPKTRTYAKALGLVNNETIFTADLSKERVALIQQVLHDSSLDPVSKLDTLKILLHGSAGI